MSEISSVVWSQIFSVALVALLLTMLELLALFNSIIPKLKEKVDAAVKSSDELRATRIPQALKILIGTLADSEERNVTTANLYIRYFAFFTMFGLLVLTTFALSKIKRSAIAITFSILTVIIIAMFQGLPCAVGIDALCFSWSFVKMTENWKQSEDFANLAFQSDLCKAFSDDDLEATDVASITSIKTMISRTFTRSSDDELRRRIRTELQFHDVQDDSEIATATPQLVESVRSGMSVEDAVSQYLII